MNFGFRNPDENPYLKIVSVRSKGVEHFAISHGGKKPFIPTMKECHSIKLLQDDVVVDIGAYVGTYAKWCAEAGVRKVSAYEPTPFTCRVLRMNLQSFEFAEVHEVAVVGDKFESDSVLLHISEGLGVTNGLVGRKRGQSDVKVPVVKFSSAVAGATVVKIDVEGAEYDYEFGALPDSVRAVIVDFHPVGPGWIKKAEAVVDVLHRSGFVDVVTPDWSNGWTRAGSWIRKKTRGKR